MERSGREEEKGRTPLLMAVDEENEDEDGEDEDEEEGRRKFSVQQ